MPDGDNNLFTVTDLKQYIYCPRIFYYHACLPDIRPITFKMQAGIDAHETEQRRSARRSVRLFGDTAGQRYYDVPLHSTTLRLTGQVDEAYVTDHEIIPVDYKLAKRSGYHFTVQLAAYALLLEETYQTPVRRGFLYLMLRNKAEEVPITPKLRRAVQQALAAMQRIADSEWLPPPTDWRQRCPDCEFRRFCNDV